MENYYHKYLKYKNKYLALKNNSMIGGKINSNTNEPFDEKSIIILPKGTLLFRVVEDPKTDFIGVPYDGKHCIASSLNVFFYFSPFIVDGIPKWFKDFKDLHIYITTKDIRILSMINNSIYNRGSKTTGTILTTCDTIKSKCIKGRPYDPCFTDAFLKEYPDVMGWVAITKNDSKKFKKELKHGVLNDNEKKKYIHLVPDNRGVSGPPELALYPTTKREIEDVIIDNPDEWMKNHEFNYKHILTLKRDKKTLLEFMEKHSIYNSNTKFYTYKE